MVVTMSVVVVVLGLHLGDRGFRRQDDSRDARSVLQRGPHHLRRVDDPSGNEILEHECGGVVALRVGVSRSHLLDDQRALGE